MTDAQDSLDALAARAAQGDQQALDELLSEIQPRVRRICGRMLLYPEDAEEAAQDALLLVSTRIHTFAGRSRFTTWLHAVASNSARSTYRSLKRRSAELPTDDVPTAADPAHHERDRRQPSRLPRGAGDAWASTTRRWSSRSCCATSRSSTTPTSPTCSRSRWAP